MKPLPAPIWFVAAFIPMVVSQVLRLHQHNPGGWLFWDYAGRLAGLAVLAALAWPVAFRREKLRMPWMQIPLWVLGIVLADHYLRLDQDGRQPPVSVNSSRRLPAVQGLAALVRHPVRDWARHLHARKSSFDDALGTCSSLTWATECLWCCSRRCCSALIIGGRVSGIY